MARASREDKQHRRAREGLAVAHARQDAELGVTCLLRLPPQERAAELPLVARLFRDSVARDHRRGDWSRLSFWAARADCEPRLLLQDEAVGNGAGGASETRWALLWACARSGLWDRARGHAAALVGRLPLRLQSAIEIYVSASGAPAVQGSRDLFQVPAVDPRLGYDRGQRGAGSAPLIRQPRSFEDVESAVLACASLRSSSDFATTVEQWAAASPELATAILTFAARIQRGAILARMCEGASALEPAQSLAAFLARLGPPETLSEQIQKSVENEVVLALRVAASLVRRPKPLDRQGTSGVAAILRVAATFPRLRPCVFALTLDCTLEAESTAIALDLLERLCQLPAAGPLWLMALVLSESHSSGATAALRWVSAGLADLLRHPGEVAGALAQLPASKRRDVLESAMQTLPMRDAELFLEEAWALADDAIRPALFSGLDELLRRASERPGDGLSPFELEQVLADLASREGLAPSRAEIRQILASPEGRRIALSLESEFGGGPEGGPLPATARRIWDRFADRAIPSNVSYLELALAQGERKPERMRTMERFLGERLCDGTAIVDSLWSAERARCRLASEALLEHLLGTLGGDRQKLALALLQASKRRLRRAVRGALARAFDSADAIATANEHHAAAASPDILSARLEARLATTPHRTKRKATIASGKKRRGTKPKIGQGSIPFGEGDS